MLRGSHSVLGPPPSARVCAICGVTISKIARIPFCDTHRHAYDERQVNGAATEDLDTRWYDTLVIWRERPSTLDREPQPELFRFRRRVGSWMAFMRGYPQGLPDWIAINISTKEIRRFVEINQFDLLDDLEGIRPAPNQDRLAERWGKPEGRESPKAFVNRYRDANGVFSLSSMIQNAQIPVYGVSENPFGLRLCSTGYSDTPRGPISVELKFARPDPISPNAIVSLRSFKGDTRHIGTPPACVSDPIPSQALLLLKEYKPDLMNQIEFVSPQSLARHIVVPGFECDTDLLYWKQPVNLFTFALRHEEVVLNISALGLSEEVLFHLLRYVNIINDRLQLLEQYQTELDQMRALRTDNRRI